MIILTRYHQTLYRYHDTKKNLTDIMTHHYIPHVHVYHCISSHAKYAYIKNICVFI